MKRHLGDLTEFYGDIPRPKSFAASLQTQRYVNLISRTSPPWIKVWARNLGAQYSRLLLTHTQQPTPSLVLFL